MFIPSVYFGRELIVLLSGGEGHKTVYSYSNN